MQLDTNNIASDYQYFGTSLTTQFQQLGTSLQQTRLITLNPNSIIHIRFCECINITFGIKYMVSAGISDVLACVAPAALEAATQAAAVVADTAIAAVDVAFVANGAELRA